MYAKISVVLFALLIVTILLFRQLAPRESSYENQLVSPAKSARSTESSSKASSKSKNTASEEWSGQNESRQERLDRLRAEADQVIKAEREAAAKRVWAPLAVSESGKLTTAIIEFLDLSDSEIEQIDLSLERLKAEALKDFTERVKVTYQSEENKEIHFYARASKDRGALLSSSLESEIESAIGDRRAKSFIEGIDSFSTNFLLGRGKRDLSVKFIDETVTVQYFSPSSGDLQSELITTVERFKDEFGAYFAFD